MSNIVDIEELRAIAVAELDLPVDKLTPDAHFADVVGFDSLMALELAMVLEKKYNVEIDDEEMRKCASLRQVQELLTSKLKQSV